MVTDDDLIKAMQACVNHARALLESARAVQAAGHPNVAYHLAVLALEELGRRELFGVQTVAANQSKSPPAWAEKHTQNHIKKLFWCFFGANFFEEKLTAKALDSINGFAQNLHAKRLEGLYVSQDNDGLAIPSEAIQPDECETIVALAEARLGMAGAEKLRENIPVEDTNLQAWFLGATDDREKRRYIFSGTSMSKLAELKNAKAWTQWLKAEFDKNEAEGLALAQQEIERSRNIDGKGSKKKWKVRIRIFSDSHSIRPKALTDWNSKIDWIKLVAVPDKKNQLIVEFILLDNVPVDALWYFTWGLARHFVVALNIGTMGFWWWRMPEQISKYYESIEDIDLKHMLRLERSPSLKVDWGKNRVLTEEDLNFVSSCFVALPGPHDRDQHEAFNYYIGGVTFLSLNDVHWQCESTVFGNFFECMRAMMAEVGDWKKDTPFEPVLADYLDKSFPGMDEDRDQFLKICRAFEMKSPESVTITLKEASFAKLFCDAYFLNKLRPTALVRKSSNTAGS